MPEGLQLPRRNLIAGAGLLAMVVTVALTPQLLGSQVQSALDALGGASRPWLALAACGFLLSIAGAAGAWRSALRSLGSRIGPVDACAYYGSGALVNSFVPARLGDAVRVALFSRALEGEAPVLRSSGVFAAIGAARALALASLVVFGVVAGQMPVWPLFVLGAAVALAVVLSLLLRRRNPGSRVAHLLDAFREFGREPRAGARVVAWILVATTGRVLAAAAAAAALGLAHPLQAALLVVPALDVAGLMPLTPGNVGVTSGAIAVALQTQGIGLPDGLAMGIAFHAVETMVGVGTGLASVLYLAWPSSPGLRRWAPRAAVAGACLCLAAGLGIMVSDLV